MPCVLPCGPPQRLPEGAGGCGGSGWDLGDTRHYWGFCGDPLSSSTMSSAKRWSSFMLAALRMVRMDRAVRPCFPITLPMSLGSTRRRRTVALASVIASTEARPGWSTNASAIPVMSSLILHETGSTADNESAWTITYLWESYAHHP